MSENGDGDADTQHIHHKVGKKDPSQEIDRKLTLEEKLLLEEQINMDKFLTLLTKKTLSRFFFIVALDILIFFGLFYYEIYLSLGWIFFFSSGISFLIAGTIGTVGTSVSIQKFTNLIFNENPSIDEQKSKEERSIGTTLIYLIVGLLLFVLSYFF